jgi:hypothetical protein
MSEAIIKPIFGSLGHGMVRVADAGVALRVVRPLEPCVGLLYSAPSQAGCLRVFVVGGRVLGAIGGWPAAVQRTNGDRWDCKRSICPHS